MADAITWVIDANGSKVTAEMQRLLQTARSSSGGIVESYRKVETTNTNLLQSHRSVGRAANYAAQDLLRGASALDVFASSSTFLAAALRLPLGPLLALVTAALGANKIREIRAEFAGLNKEAAELEKKDLIKLKTDELEKAKAEAERISKGLKEQLTGVKGFVNAVAKGRGPGFDSDPVARRADALRNTVMGDAFTGAKPQLLDFQREQAERYHKKRMEDIPKEVDAEIERRNKAAALKADVEAFKSKLQLSLAEIAKEGHRPSHYFDSGRTPAADLARRAMSEEDLARKAMLRERPDLAIHHQSRAEELKAGIPGLRDADKISTLKSALDTSTKIREIAANTAKTLTNR